MLKFEVHGSSIKHAEHAGNIVTLGIELGGVIGCLHGIIKKESAEDAELFRKILQSVASDGSPVWEEDFAVPPEDEG